MAAVTFDAFKFVETLKGSWYPETQAKAFSTAVQESHETTDLATKRDIADLRHEIKELELRITSRFDSKLADLKFELLKWLIGLAIAQTGLLIGSLKFLP
jgi:hypothetical protein